jgi:hypothetical protein
MAVQKKPLYVFETTNDQGIYDVPEFRIVLVEDAQCFYFLQNKDGLSSTSTVQQAINSANLIPFWSELNDGFDSGLPAQYTKLWNGHYLYGVSPDEPPANEGQTGDIWFQYDI